MVVEKLGVDRSLQIEINPTLHQPRRLMMVAFLSSHRGRATAPEMKAGIGGDYNSLGAHAAVLQGAGYIEIRKEIVGLTPTTTFTLTANGREAFRRYKATLGEIMEVAA